jgi:inosose dehydratase
MSICVQPDYYENLVQSRRDEERNSMAAYRSAIAEASTSRHFGVELITFFDPEFWGVTTRDEMQALAKTDPAFFWCGILDALTDAGIGQLELTFAPADYATAVAAFGSADGVRSELESRGMQILSGYFGDLEHAAEIEAPGLRDALVLKASEYCDFLAAVGARYLVLGLPMRRNRVAGVGYEPVDLAVAQPIAEIVNAIGAASADRGITTALHTESHSVFWTSRDVDLFMLLTDDLLVGLCADTAHLVLAGADPIEVVRRHRDRLVFAHWKDAAGPFEGQPPIDDAIFARHQEYFRPLGDGRIDWSAWVSTLDEIGFDGCILLELDATADPVADMTRARERIEMIINHRTVR